MTVSQDMNLLKITYCVILRLSRTGSVLGSCRCEDEGREGGCKRLNHLLGGRWVWWCGC